MNKLLEFLIHRSRTMLLILATLLVCGAYSYVTMPKESEPDVSIPIIYVSMVHKGISPEDAERLLIRPMEKELRDVTGVKEMRSTGMEGTATVTLEFEAGFDSDKALEDVRAKVDIAKAELPDETEEPTVNEVNFSLFPVLVVGLSGEIPERALLKIANDLKDKIEALPEILEVDIVGDREDMLEVLIDPIAFESYGLEFEEIIRLITQNNKLVAAGTLDVGKGRFSLKVPGLFETQEDIFNLPIKVSDDRVISLKDIATIRKSYEDPQSFARFSGRPGLALEVKKRSGENVIETINATREIVRNEQKVWPQGIKVDYFQDKSNKIREMLTDLQNNLISAIALVMVVIIATLGIRTAGLVGVAIPGSFLAGLFVLNLMGLTINIVVLFSLILVVGMLVDGAIVVTEFADRKMTEGMSKGEAYVLASQRMSLPIIASTATTLVAFMPLLFWPGIVGQFMKYLPITLIATLAASLFMALIFVPTLGTLFGKPAELRKRSKQNMAVSESGDLTQLEGAVGDYIRMLKRVIQRPFLVLFVGFLALVGSYMLYGAFGKGVEFFPNVEPERFNINVRIRGNLSVYEFDETVREVEKRIVDMPEFATVYSRSGVDIRAQDITEDTHGIILIEFVDWQKRRKAKEILDDVRARLQGVPGVVIEVAKERAGPPVGKPVKLQLTSRFSEKLEPELEKIVKKMHSMKELTDIDDSLPVPGIEWRVEVDREQASRFGADVNTAGNVIQFVSTGYKVDGYRPEDADDEVDIRIRFPLEYRNLSQIDRLRIPTSYGLVPLSNFVKQSPADKVSRIERVDGKRTLNARADVIEGALVDKQVRELEQWIKNEADIDPDVRVQFKGEDEEQREAQEFLMKAFMIALATMAIILVTQFNSFYDAFLILTAVIFSTVGVLLGLIITGQPFGIVMNGIGVISLAGIVVNNNIVLIDTFIRLKREMKLEITDAILRTCAQRFRPVMLTTVTTILGLIPMVTGVNIDFISREVTMDAPSTQWWAQLSTSVAFGLAFATILTLVLTPSLLMLGHRVYVFVLGEKAK